jgi:hypothetical protein
MLSLGHQRTLNKCNTAYMKQRKSQKEILKQLVSDGHLTSDQAGDIAQAPKLAVTARELVSYLAAILITIGAVFMVSGLVVDVPRAGIAALLYVVAVVVGYFSHKLSSAASEKKRVGEVLEIRNFIRHGKHAGGVVRMHSCDCCWNMGSNTCVTFTVLWFNFDDGFSAHRDYGINGNYEREWE